MNCEDENEIGSSSSFDELLRRWHEAVGHNDEEGHHVSDGDEGSRDDEEEENVSWLGWPSSPSDSDGTDEEPSAHVAHNAPSTAYHALSSAPLVASHVQAHALLPRRASTTASTSPLKPTTGHSPMPNPFRRIRERIRTIQTTAAAVETLEDRRQKARDGYSNGAATCGVYSFAEAADCPSDSSSDSDGLGSYDGHYQDIRGGSTDDGKWATHNNTDTADTDTRKWPRSLRSELSNNADGTPVEPPKLTTMDGDEVKALARKTGVAVAGGSLIALGVPFLPLPGPGGETMMVAGMAVLAKEFPAAQKVLDGTRDAIVDVLDKTAPNEDEEEDDEREEDMKPKAKHNGKSTFPSIPANVQIGGFKVYRASERVDDFSCWNEQSDIGASTSNPSSHNRSERKRRSRVRFATRHLHRHAHSLGRNVVVPLLDTVCTEREGASSLEQSIGKSAKVAFSGARSRIVKSFRSLSSEVVAGWREVEEEYILAEQARVLSLHQGAANVTEEGIMESQVQTRYALGISAGNSEWDVESCPSQLSPDEDVDEVWETQSCSW